MKQQKKKTFRNIPDTRSAFVPYAMSTEEIKEYALCYNNIFFFLQHTLSLKLEPFQVKMVQNYIDNKFSLNMCSREVGQSTIMSAVFLYDMIFKKEHTIFVMSKSGMWMERVFDHYRKVPYHMQPGIRTMKSGKYIHFDNGSRLSCRPYSKNGALVLGCNYSSIVLKDFAYLSNEHQRTCLQSIVPIVGARRDCKLTLSSQPNGMNVFYDILIDAERFEGDPKKNRYNVFRAYWWQIPGRDQQWKEDKIKMCGEETFNTEYDLSFKTK